eukprot:gene3265-35975_t
MRPKEIQECELMEQHLRDCTHCSGSGWMIEPGCFLVVTKEFWTSRTVDGKPGQQLQAMQQGKFERFIDGDALINFDRIKPSKHWVEHSSLKHLSILRGGSRIPLDRCTHCANPHLCLRLLARVTDQGPLTGLRLLAALRNPASIAEYWGVAMEADHDASHRRWGRGRVILSCRPEWLDERGVSPADLVGERGE